MSLARCPGCCAPVTACFCDRLTLVPSRVPVVVVRHVSERLKASNTGHLTAKIIGGRLIEHGAPGERTDLTGALGDAGYVLYPRGQSPDPWPIPSALVVLDGTWGQARRMRTRIPGVAGLPTLSIDTQIDRPRMRAQRIALGLSTMEAVAEALDLLGEPEPAAALRAVYDEMTARWLWFRQHPATRENLLDEP